MDKKLINNSIKKIEILMFIVIGKMASVVHIKFLIDTCCYRNLKFLLSLSLGEGKHCFANKLHPYNTS